MAAVLVRALNINNPSSNQGISFKDNGDIDSWARKAVSMAVEKGLIKGYGDNTFHPKNYATRAEAATMITKLLELKKGGG